MMPQNPTYDSEHGEVIETAIFIGYDWVTAVTYEAGHGWRVIFQSGMEDNILSDGYFRSEDLHDEHPIQQGMDAMQAAASEEDDEWFLSPRRPPQVFTSQVPPMYSLSSD
jgi:hypothetical protein